MTTSSGHLNVLAAPWIFQGLELYIRDGANARRRVGMIPSIYLIYVAHQHDGRLITSIEWIVWMTLYDLKNNGLRSCASSTGWRVLCRRDDPAANFCYHRSIYTVIGRSDVVEVILRCTVDGMYVHLTSFETRDLISTSLLELYTIHNAWLPNVPLRCTHAWSS
jgi:hypothetical protein